MQGLERARGWYWPKGYAEHAGRYLGKGLRPLDGLLEMIPVDRRSVCVQAGGHVGIWPARLADAFRYVYTFEPEPRNFQALAANLAAKSNVYPARGVLAHDRGPIELNVHGHNSGGHHMRFAAGATPVYRIDDLALPACDAIVLDVEGAEIEALLGAERTIEQYRPWIMVEMRGHIAKKVGRGTDEDLRTLLRESGYSLHKTLVHDEVWAPCN
jgi:FkbM family methyltransferase